MKQSIDFCVNSKFSCFNKEVCNGSLVNLTISAYSCHVHSRDLLQRRRFLSFSIISLLLAIVTNDFRLDFRIDSLLDKIF